MSHFVVSGTRQPLSPGTGASTSTFGPHSVVAQSAPLLVTVPIARTVWLHWVGLHPGGDPRLQPPYGPFHHIGHMPQLSFLPPGIWPCWHGRNARLVPTYCCRRSSKNMAACASNRHLSGLGSVVFCKFL